jgi:hypothetical protein
VQTASVLKAGLNTEWAVIPPWVRATKGNSITSTAHAIKATLVSDKHYMKSTGLSKDASWFQTTSEKNFGLLVQIPNRSGDMVYAVISASHFISSWTEYDTFWVAENLRLAEVAKVHEAKRAAQQAKADARQAVETKALASSNEVAERLAVSIEQTLAELLGARFSTAKRLGSVAMSVRSKGTWNNLDLDNEEFVVVQTGSISMDLQLFQRLLEKAVNN